MALEDIIDLKSFVQQTYDFYGIKVIKTEYIKEDRMIHFTFTANLPKIVHLDIEIPKEG